MTAKGISSRAEAEKWLRSGCERCIAFLSELSALHLSIDGPNRMAIESEAECVLILRKVYLHIRAITSWAVDSDVLHVMGPDIRAAREQLEPMVREQLYDGRDKPSLAQRRRYVAEKEKQLAHFSHPTPVILIHDRRAGGLGKTDTILYLSTLYELLGGLVVDYGLGLGVAAGVLGSSKQSEILSVITRAEKEITSRSPDEFLKVPKGEVWD